MLLGLVVSPVLCKNEIQTNRHEKFVSDHLFIRTGAKRAYPLFVCTRRRNGLRRIHPHPATMKRFLCVKGITYTPHSLFNACIHLLVNTCTASNQKHSIQSKTIKIIFVFCHTNISSQVCSEDYDSNLIDSLQHFSTSAPVQQQEASKSVSFPGKG